MRWVMFLLLIAALSGCGPRPQSCRSAHDCAAAQVCERYFCVALEPVDEVPPDDAGTDTDAGSEDGVVDIDAGPNVFRMGGDGGDGDAGFYCTSHAECAPLKCKAHVCQ